MVAREIFEKCTVVRLGVPCGLTRHPLRGMAKWPPTCYNCRIKTFKSFKSCVMFWPEDEGARIRGPKHDIRFE